MSMDRKKNSLDRNSENKDEELSLSEQHLKKISSLLYEKYLREERKRKYTPVKEVLTLLAKLGMLTMIIVAPNTAVLAKELFKEEEDWEAWKKYNPSYLRRTIARLEKQKEVEIIEDDGLQVVKIATQGKVKLLKYALKELKIKKTKKWDCKWRLVIYDIPLKYKKTQEFFRNMLSQLSFYPLQESVYLYPYPCKDEIEYLRQILNISQYVRILTIEKIENDMAFRSYFGLNS